ncbi:MAG: hypothetical protein HY694_03860 [Deltaproteobacteria bacterium]|nr:hypothetical protein [Deltaproteobacteria bacterium]
MTESPPKTRQRVKSTPNVFLRNLVGFVATLGGGAFFTTFAPPVEPSAIVPVAVIPIAAIAWLVGFVLAQRRDLREALKKHFKRLLLFAGAFCFLPLVVLLVLYVILWNTYTVAYSGTRLVIGTELTSRGQHYFKENPNASNEEAVWDAAGRPQDIWTAGSIQKWRFVLWVVFLLLVFMTVFPIILTAYSVRTESGDFR